MKTRTDSAGTPRAGLLPAAALIAAAMLVGCAETPPVGENITTYRYYQTRPRFNHPDSYGTVAPVGEGPIASPDEGYYDTISGAWERPWPYAPADASSPGWW